MVDKLCKIMYHNERKGKYCILLLNIYIKKVMIFWHIILISLFI